MPFTKVDEKGRMMLPSEIRRKTGISPADEFVADELGPNTILLKKVDVRAMMRDVITNMYENNVCHEKCIGGAAE